MVDQQQLRKLEIVTRVLLTLFLKKKNSVEYRTEIYHTWSNYSLPGNKYDSLSIARLCHVFTNLIWLKARIIIFFHIFILKKGTFF